MINTLQYALMAGAAYFDTRTEGNRLPDPVGWINISRFPTALSNGSGFEAIAFQREIGRAHVELQSL